MAKKGVVHSIDAFFAAVIIVTALLYTSQIPREQDYREDKNLKDIGMQAMVALDGNGTLGRLVGAGDWNNLENTLRLVLPTWVSFNLTVFYEEETVINNRVISNGGLVGRRIDSVDYLIVLESNNCSFFKLRLQLGG